jgi:hypothetical protein
MEVIWKSSQKQFLTKKQKNKKILPILRGNRALENNGDNSG